MPQEEVANNLAHVDETLVIDPAEMTPADSEDFEVPHSVGRDGFFDYREEKTMHSVQYSGSGLGLLLKLDE
jgi:AMP deaminase